MESHQDDGGLEHMVYREKCVCVLEGWFLRL